VARQAARVALAANGARLDRHRRPVMAAGTGESPIVQIAVGIAEHGDRPLEALLERETAVARLGFYLLGSERGEDRMRHGVRADVHNVGIEPLELVPARKVEFLALRGARRETRRRVADLPL